MSKRYNVLKGLNDQLKQGNQYIASDGNVVSEMYLNDQLMNEYTRGLRLKSIDVSITFADYSNRRLAEYTKVVDMMELIESVLNPNFGDTDVLKRLVNKAYGSKVNEIDKSEYVDTDSVGTKPEEKPEAKEAPKPTESKTAANAFKDSLKIQTKIQPKSDTKVTK